MAINLIDEKWFDGSPSFSVTVYDEPKKYVRLEIYDAFVYFQIDWINTDTPIVRIEEKNTGILVKENKGLDTQRRRDTINAIFNAKVIRR